MPKKQMMMMMVKTVSDVIVRNKTLPLAVMANQAQALSCWLNSILVQAHVGHKGLWRGGRGGGLGTDMHDISFAPFMAVEHEQPLCMHYASISCCALVHPDVRAQHVSYCTNAHAHSV